jgi:phosphoglycerol transferase MdoB-like AlkP superfamily enzyme
MVLDELRSPREAFGMIWQSYPVAWGLLALALLAWGWSRLGAHALRVAELPARPTRPRSAGAWLVGALAMGLGLYGNLSWYPLRWSQAFFDANPFVSALASNPVLYFAETLTHRSRLPDRESVVRHYDRLAELLEVDERDPRSLSFARRVVPERRPPFRPNLVVVHLESWAAFQTGALGNALPSSPHFDALARDSLLFTSCFVPTGPTARSVFSMLTGIPDVPANNPESSASRDPRAVRQPTLVNALAGYEKHYFLGGSANWANIRAILAGNIADLEIHEEGGGAGERVDVWGVSDVDLFESAVQTLDACAGPFFAFVQTSGNHAPYTIPSRSEGFEPAALEEETLRRSGFKSREAYDGFRFLDHALGRFFALAKERPWYRDTVFVLYGDHGVPAVNGVPFERIGLVRHHVPLLIHAPRLIPAGARVEYPASSVDVLPTCLSLMGVPYLNSALGRDLLAPRESERRFAFLSVGLVQGQWFLRRELDGRTMLYRYASGAPEEDFAAREPELVQRLTTLHRALEDWALWTQHDGARRLELEREPY